MARGLRRLMGQCRRHFIEVDTCTKVHSMDHSIILTFHRCTDVAGPVEFGVDKQVRRGVPCYWQKAERIGNM